MCFVKYSDSINIGYKETWKNAQRHYKKNVRKKQEFIWITWENKIKYTTEGKYKREEN
jgi:hypothetical protein